MNQTKRKPSKPNKSIKSSVSPKQLKRELKGINNNEPVSQSDRDPRGYNYLDSAVSASQNCEDGGAKL